MHNRISGSKVAQQKQDLMKVKEDEWCLYQKKLLQEHRELGQAGWTVAYSDCSAKHV